MSTGNSENSGGDIAVLSVNPNSDGLSAQTEPMAEEHTRGPDSSNGVFVPNESDSSAVSSSESPASSVLIAQHLRVDSNYSSSTSHDACDGLPSATLDHHSAVDPSSDEEDNLESSLLLNEAADGECESGKIKTAEICVARDGHTDSDPVSSSGRVRRSSNLEHAPGLQQDALPDGDMSVGQNGSGACGGDGKDSTVDQSVSDLSTQSYEWERLGARPRDRPQTIFPVEPSLAGPVAHGVSSVFLARHSQDESLNQGSAEQVLPDDTSSQGASYVDEPNKAKPYFGGCQVASRPDAHSRSLFPHLPNGSLMGGAEPQLTPSSTCGATRNMARVDVGSSGLPSPYSVAESTSTSQYAPVSPSNNTLNTAGDRLVAAAANREGNLDPPHIDAAFPSGNSRVSRLVAGANTKPHGAEASLPSANSGGSMLNRDFVGTSSVESPGNSLRALEQRVQEACAMAAMVEKVLRERVEQEQFGREIEKKEREVRELRARKRREREARELEEASRWPQEQEAITGRGPSQWLCEHCKMQLLCSPTTESLESNPSSDAEFCRRVAKARAKILEREGAARSIEDANRRWCTCEEESEEELNPICRRCCKHRYLGPACLSRHDNCSCYLQIGEDSGKCRSCGGNVSAGVSRLVAGANTEPHGAEPSLPSANSGGSMLNRDVGTGTVESTDNSLLALEQRVEEACAMVEKVLREREERELFGREIKKKEREIRELRARKRREREARELEEARRWPQQQEAITGRGRLQIGEDSGKCRSCGGNMSAYFCSICKHFTSVDKNPYHCEKCGICRIHEDKSFHCDVCNVCLDKRLEGKHKCRPDSGHDKCCICLEDAFSGCQILPCSHKVHRECAIAMIQNGIRTCPVCRHPFYIPASE